MNTKTATAPPTEGKQQESMKQANQQKKLIGRWDSERELFYDDIVHAEASACAHWTDFLISTKHLR